jgi:hypothetical protein
MAPSRQSVLVLLGLVARYATITTCPGLSYLRLIAYERFLLQLQKQTSLLDR